MNEELKKHEALFVEGLRTLTKEKKDFLPFYKYGTWKDIYSAVPFPETEKDKEEVFSNE